jgi:filamentous hemagglutinin
MHTISMKRFTRGAASTAICAALALGTAGVASAHDGQKSHHGNQSHHSDSRPHNKVVGGIVTALGTGSVTIQSRNRAPVTYATTSTTTYTLDKTAATVAVLAVGENVDLTLTSTSPQMVTAVVVDLGNVEGKVTAIVGNTITIGSGSDAKTVTVSASTTYTLHGAVSTLSAITIGSKIEAKGVSSSTPGINALSVKIEPLRLDTRAEGTITALGTNSVTIQSHGDTPVAYTTTSTTSYTLGTTAATVSSLAVGENVDLALTSTAPQTVTAVEVDLANVEGKVTAISGNTITLKSGSDVKTVTVGASTTYTLHGAVSTLSAIVLGSNIEARGVSTSSSALNATSVKIELVRLHTRAEGTITALGTNSVTIQDRNGALVTYTTTSTTTYTLGETAATVAVLAVGENVDLALTSTAPQMVTAVEVDLGNVEGKVTAIVGNTITIGSGSDAKTVTVSASTTYTLHGAASTLSAIAVGSHIEAWGVSTSSTAINASSVNINLGN